MKLFATYQRNSETFYSAYQGQDEATIRALLTELGATDIGFISEQDYLAYVQSLAPRR